MKEFKTIEEAKEYGKNFGKYDYETIQVNDKRVILVGTELVIEELIRNKLEDIYDSICKIAGVEVDEDIICEWSSDAESEIESKLEDNGVQIIRVFDEF